MRASRQTLQTASSNCPGIWGRLLAVARITGDGHLEIPDGEFKVLAQECPGLAEITSESRGLGDIVHLVFSPVVHFSDEHLGTDLAHCAGCDARREWLNRAGKNLKNSLAAGARTV